MNNYNKVQEIYARNRGSEALFHRPYCQTLNYTEGIMDFQKTLSAHWVVDNMISYLPTISKSHAENGFTFFVVEISLNDKQEGYVEVYTDDYVEGIYNEHIGILKQDISFIDLPLKDDKEITTYRFFLSVTALDPLKFIFFLPSEY